MFRPPAFILSAALLCSTLVGMSPVHAGLFDDDEARKAIIELRGRVEAVNKALGARLDELGQRMDEMAQRLERMEATQRGQLELQGQIEVLKKELADLRGKLEVQTNELARTQVQTRDLAASVNSNVESKIGALDARLKKIEPSLMTLVLDDRNVTVSADEKRLFDAALSLFRSSDFRSAAVAFAQFQAQYPESAYTANALFWSASSLFGLKEYKNSVALNEKFLSRFADHPKAADATLNLAFSQIELNDRAGARKSFDTVIEKYPNTDASRLARERLSTLRR
jgi:tol-pal system protein YbgF